MAGSQLSALAIAACKAGALGSLPCAMLSPDGVRKELAAIRAATDRPFNVNFFCHTPPPADAQREAAWHKALAPYYAEYGIDPASIPAGPGRAPFSAEAAAILEEFRPAVVSFHFGLPPPRASRTGKKAGREGPVLRDHGRRSALAGEAGRRRDHRAGRGGGRASRTLPVGRFEHAARHGGAAAAAGPRGEGAGDRGGRHRRCGRREGGDGARRGRRMGRNQATKRFTIADLEKQTEGVVCRKDKGVLDEIPGAYKDIDEVMENQSDLVEVVHTLKQVICVKG